MKLLLASVSALAILAAMPAAHAGKKNDTLNIGKAESLEGGGPIYTPSGENQMFNRTIFDTLISVDLETGKLVPLLATSWKQLDKLSWEFKLRKDVTFHDGSKFNADDVVYTVNWTSNKKNRFRSKNRFTWMKGAEKIDDYTLRIHTKKPFALATMRWSTGFQILPSDIHGALKKKSTFGFKPVGTGAYRAASFDKNKGAVLIRRDKYPQANRVRPVPSIKRVVVKHIPDEQTRVAEIFTGGIDLGLISQKAVADGAAKRSGVKVTAVNGLQYFYMYPDSADKTGVGFFKDARVRKALVHAIDRKAIKENIIIGGPKSYTMTALCIPFQVGCKSATATPPEYDPAKAKKLLAEAGYPNGFEFEITTRARERELALAVSGYLRKVGIKTKVKSVTRVAYRKLQRAGKLQLLIGSYGSGGMPDVSPLISFHFANKARDYAQDKKLNGLEKAAYRTFDPAERNKILGQALDLVSEQNYVVPLAAAPQVFLHTEDLALPTNTINGFGVVLNKLKWN